MYNGWNNYETWLVNLWMDNSKESNTFWSGLAEEKYNGAAEDKYLTRPEVAAIDLAEALKEYHNEDCPELPLGIYSDLLRAALDTVDWLEIAVAWIARITEEVNV